MRGTCHQHLLLQLPTLLTVVHPTAEERDKGGMEDVVGFGTLTGLWGKGESEQNFAGLQKHKMKSKLWRICEDIILYYIMSNFAEPVLPT